MSYLLLRYLRVPHKRPRARLWVQISFKYKRLLFTKQEILANFNYFSFLPLFFFSYFQYGTLWDASQRGFSPFLPLFFRPVFRLI